MADKNKRRRKRRRAPARFHLSKEIKFNRIQMYRSTRTWLLRTIPQLQQYAAQFDKEKAFVLAPGPSCLDVTPEEWRGLESYFTIGVNRMPNWLQKHRDITALPSLCLLVDRVGPGKNFDITNRALEQCEGRVLVDELATTIYHDWSCVAFGMNPSWDIRDGLTLVPSLDMILWPRTTVCAAHLAALLGFRNIYYIGADHSAEYKEKEPEDANVGYKIMAEFLGLRGVNLFNCGARSSITVLPQVLLAEALMKADSS